MTLYAVQGWVLVALGAAALGLQLWALVHAGTTRADAFPAAGKRTKGFWLAICGVATAIGFVSLFGPLNIFNLVAIVAAIVYLTDVRPAVGSIRGGRQGPYGPW